MRLPIRAATRDKASVLLSGLPLWTPGEAAFRCSVSADGRRLLYGRYVGLVNVWRLDFSGSTAKATAMTQGSASTWAPAASPDGQSILAMRVSGGGLRGGQDLLKGGEPVVLTEGGPAALSPDGQRLAFISARSGAPRVSIAQADGLEAKEVTDSALGDLLSVLAAGRPTGLADTGRQELSDTQPSDGS